MPLQQDRESIAQLISQRLLSLTEFVSPDMITGFREHLSIERLLQFIVREETPVRHDYEPIVFIREYEDMFYRLLFANDGLAPFYHYTTLSAAVSILSSSTLRLVSIAGLNDRAELTFGDSLLGIKGTPYSRGRIDSANERYVFSCSRVQDELTQWRLYGDDGKGACIEFRLSAKFDPTFYLALGNVIYGTKLLTLLKGLRKDILRRFHCLLSFRRFFLWKNFVKPTDWKNEKEVRLLFFNNQAKGLTKPRHWSLNKFGILNSYVEFPLSTELPIQIKGVILGPKMTEPRLNKHLLDSFRDDKNLPPFTVTNSRKKYYR